MTTVDLEGLSQAELSLVARFVELLRRRDESADARAAFAAFWREWTEHAPPVDEEEAQELVDEAVRYARGA